MALVKAHDKDWQLVLSNTSNQIVLYHPPTKSLKVTQSLNPQTQHDSICPNCLRPMQPDPADDIPPTTNYFRLLSELEGARTPPYTKTYQKPPYQKRNSIADVQPAKADSPRNPTHSYHSHAHDVTSRVDGYYAKFFVELRQIGRGAYASVHLCQHTLNDNALGLYAVKKVAVGLSSAYLTRALQEVKLLESLRHPHIVDYHHSWVELATLTQFGPRVPTLYLLMSFANGGSLAELIYERRGGNAEGVDKAHSPSNSHSQSRSYTNENFIAETRKQRRQKRQNSIHSAHSTDTHTNNNTDTPAPTPTHQHLRTEELLQLLKHITDGLDFLHSKGIMHLDLKPANVLLSWDDVGDSSNPSAVPRAMLSDFGSSLSLAGVRGGNGDIDKATAQRTGQTGTMEYASPEALHVDANGHLTQQHSFTQDMWSLGMIMHEMIFLALPWHTLGECGATDYDVLSAEIANYRGFSEEDVRQASLSFPHLPISLFRLLAKLLSRDSARRPLAHAVLEEVEWIEKGIGVGGYGAAYSNHSAAHTHTHTAKQTRKLPPPPRILPRILPAIPLKGLYMAGGVLVKLHLITEKRNIWWKVLVTLLIAVDVESVKRSKSSVLVLLSTLFLYIIQLRHEFELTKPRTDTNQCTRTADDDWKRRYIHLLHALGVCDSSYIRTERNAGILPRQILGSEDTRGAIAAGFIHGWDLCKLRGVSGIEEEGKSRNKKKLIKIKRERNINTYTKIQISYFEPAELAG
ncbi:hypothetical protein E3P78_02529 [Wallemia ichthyophaga]|nr:hypothetical protein E3P78_02529 [Wallemia ichthyophaga]